MIVLLTARLSSLIVCWGSVVCKHPQCTPNGLDFLVQHRAEARARPRLYLCRLVFVSVSWPPVDKPENLPGIQIDPLSSVSRLGSYYIVDFGARKFCCTAVRSFIWRLRALVTLLCQTSILMIVHLPLDKHSAFISFFFFSLLEKKRKGSR